jgi:hypothetical protein
MARLWRAAAAWVGARAVGPVCPLAVVTLRWCCLQARCVSGGRLGGGWAAAGCGLWEGMERGSLLFCGMLVTG